MTVPEIRHHPLSRADGSATFISALHSILVAVSGPVEVGRRDELPEEATIEVNVRPISGVGGPRERWLESVVQSVLHSVILVHMHPRTLIQITFQVTQEPGENLKITGFRDAAIVPDLLSAASLALVDAGLPLRSVIVAALIGIQDNNQFYLHPTVGQISLCSSAHAFAFGRQGEMLLNESTGSFDLDQWNEVEGRARAACADALVTTADNEDNVAMEGLDGEPWMRQSIEDKIKRANEWREST